MRDNGMTTQFAEVVRDAVLDAPAALKGEPKPSVGRIVHYNAHEDGDTPAGEAWAAVITGIHEGAWVWLTVMPPRGRDPYSIPHPMPLGRGPGTWSWPERV